MSTEQPDITAGSAEKAAEKPDAAPGSTEKPDADNGGAEKPDTAPGSTEKPDAGKGGTEKPDADNGGAEKDGAGAAEAAKAEAAKADAATGAESGTADPWTSFGPASEPVPGRVRRVVRAVGRVFTHEWTLAGVAALALAVLITWPTLRYPLHTIPHDIWDPTLQAWQMAWSGHILLTDPTQLWHSNTHYPESWSFAFSDTLLGYAPAGMIGTGPVAAVLRYNIVFVLAHALALLGAYALVRQLGAGRTGAAVAAAGYATAPWLLAQAGHLHVISNGGIPLALAMLARGHGWSLRHGYRPERRRAAWAFAGWLVAAWQITLGFGIGLPFAYVMALIAIVAPVMWYIRRHWGWGVKRPFGVRLLLADLWGGAIFAATGALLAIPYFKVAELHPYAKRTIEEIELYSPPVSGFFTAPAESRIWGGLHEPARAALPWHPEMTLLPGFVLYGLALAGLFFSIWTVRQRLLLLAGVLVTGILAMGTRFFDGTFTYRPLFEYLPGWDGIRTPGRLMLWTTLLLGVLAAGAVSAFVVRVSEIAANWVPPRPGVWLRLATLLPLILVLVEGLNVTKHPIVPAQPAALRTVDGPMLVLPTNQNVDQNVMLWSTSDFQQVVNGGSGFTPQALADIRAAAGTFPDVTSVDYLRQRGVRVVVLLRDRVAGTSWEHAADAPVTSLGIQREELGDALVFRL
ncbi:hypothetical protein SAMN05444365_101983 [Micromonospora pattaloongensis]|uniref:4-amino-4-deoxy-L-arabinose transferase n=1 Tax=Micromonospora pattaloongensis TaxID=405436 RepID=A0A1H3HTM2_9ACTN|nr:hypothetical protein [Micromonospora pattaloongensis]SDY18782.1 hypothetical protein SAMN05444365_101983 [Micromonospora pattaloongensis]